MSYHSQNREIRVPPPTAPKPYSPSVAYKPVTPTYRQVKLDHFSDDTAAYPPPPPPDSFSKGYGYDVDEELPPPPPPAPPQAYAEGHKNYRNIYREEPRFSQNDDYRPPDYRTANAQSPRLSVNDGYPADNSYANIQINIAPPTPTRKSFGPDSPSDTYMSMGPRRGVSSPSSQGSIRESASVDRPVPGPMVPPTAQASYSQSNGPSQTSYTNPIINEKPASKEAEVDALTDLLVKNMTSASEGEDENFWGMCGRCGSAVSGSTNACSALDNVYHIGCFTCVGCNTPLQGKSFFAIETKPYCEVCYINSLERCSVCSKPITDRLLRATGKPYHPDCFTCVVCGKSLDGIPFTVDATNQIHCIEDFHKKFAPRCCVCQRPIMPDSGKDETVRIVAMDKSFHVDCYKCEDCNTQLSSEAEGRGCYPLDDHILCKNCNAKRIQALTANVATEL